MLLLQPIFIIVYIPLYWLQGKTDTHSVSHKLLTQTEICQRHVAIRIEQDILKLNVTVYNPQL